MSGLPCRGAYFHVRAPSLFLCLTFGTVPRKKKMVRRWETNECHREKQEGADSQCPALLKTATLTRDCVGREYSYNNRRAPSVVFFFFKLAFPRRNWKTTQQQHYHHRSAIIFFFFSSLTGGLMPEFVNTYANWLLHLVRLFYSSRAFPVSDVYDWAVVVTKTGRFPPSKRHQILLPHSGTSAPDSQRAGAGLVWTPAVMARPSIITVYY